MRKFLNNNKIFVLAYIITSLVSILFANQFGFQRMVDDQKLTYERLRNVTFPIWENNNPSAHGFLTFLQKEDFKQKKAYSNHSTAYLFFMYGLYKIESLSERMPMRQTAPIIAILLFSASLLWILSQITVQKISFAHGLVIMMCLVFILTGPGLWVPAARFNVDNVFILQLPLLLLASLAVAQKDMARLQKWIILAAFILLCPMNAALIALFVIAYSIRAEGINIKYLKDAAFILVGSIVVYLQPIIVSKLIGFTTTNSTWLFRSGLDGDMRYFGNLISAIFCPIDERPMYIIFVALASAVVQMFILIFNKWPSLQKDEREINFKLFYACLAAPYLLTCLFWPQAISIHPYLYDYLMIGPAMVFIFINTARFSAVSQPAIVWLFVFAFLTSFNLQKIAQASRNTGSNYAPWDAVQSSN
jgi:hypothetical protein